MARKRTGKKKDRVATVKTVKRMLDAAQEDKVQFVVPVLPLAAGTTVDYVLINGLTQGAGPSNRIGTRTRAKRCEVRFSAGGSTVNVAHFRVFLLYDKQPNAAGPLNAQLLYNTTAQRTYISPFNIVGSKRYDIIWDRSFTTDIFGGATDIPGERVLTVKCNLNNRITQYNTGNAGTVADINTGSFYLCYMCDTSLNSIDYSIVYYYEDA